MLNLHNPGYILHPHQYRPTMLGGLVKSLQCYQHSNRAPSPDAWDTRFFGAPLHLLLLRHQSGIAESSDHRWNLT